MWLLPEKMESAVDKCLAFCQALIKSDQKFTLNLSIGNDKLFFSNKELESSWKKKKSPSQVRREENRKRSRQNKATEEVADNGADEATVEKAECNSTAAKAEVPAVISCEECGYKATTEKGLKQHMRMKHRKLPQPTTSLLSTPEATRRQTMPDDLNSSPLPNITREETCHNCGEIFTSKHQCDTAQSDTESEQITEDQNCVVGAEELNGDGSKPVPCLTCGKTFRAETKMNALRSKTFHNCIWMD